MSIAEKHIRRTAKSPAPKRAPARVSVAVLSDEQAFRRRRNHSQIEAMTGLILQAVAFPTRKHRDFICALQSTNSGDASRMPYTPFKRAHLTLADLMMCDVTPDSRRKAVYREICALRAFSRRKGVVLFDVTSGSEEEATEYVDYLTPAADSAVQRMLSSPLWKTDKQAAKREAVAWAVEQLPRCEVEQADEEDEDEPVADYQLREERRIEAKLENITRLIEQVSEEIGRRGGDGELWRGSMMRKAGRLLESVRKTAPARLDHSALRAVRDEGRDAPGADDVVLSGNTPGDKTVRPPFLMKQSPAWRRRPLRRRRGGAQRVGTQPRTRRMPVH